MLDYLILLAIFDLLLLWEDMQSHELSIQNVMTLISFSNNRLQLSSLRPVPDPLGTTFMLPIVILHSLVVSMRKRCLYSHCRDRRINDVGQVYLISVSYNQYEVGAS